MLILYKHILIPADLGTETDYARAADAARLLLSEGGRITLLHVMEPIPAYAQAYVPTDFPTTARKVASEAVSELASALGIAGEAIVVGSAGRSILHWAEDNGADCIIITSHKPGLSNLVLGSTATWIVKHSPVALHVLR